MRKWLALSVLLCLATLLSLTALVSFAQDGDQLAPDGIPNETYYAPFPVAITLDGDMGDWDGVPTVTLTDAGGTGAAVTFAGAADDEYLYFMAQVVDDNIISGQHGPDYWNEDSVEFYVNATGNLALRQYGAGVAQVTIPALNIGVAPEEAIVSGMRGDTVAARPLVVATDTGWAIELALPLNGPSWDITPEHGLALGFQVHLNGATTADRNAKLIWSAADTNDTSYQNPSVFGALLFYEVGRNDLPVLVTPEPTPTPVPVEADAAYKNPDLPIEERVEDLLARMTLEEKVGQMTLVEKGSIVEGDIAGMAIGGLLSGGGGAPNRNNGASWRAMVIGYQGYALQSRLGIPLIYGVDAVHGHNNVYGATIFPHNIGLGAANDPDLMERIGRATAAEMAATRIYWNYAPAVSIPMDIRWGRTYEGYSQDTDIVTALATAYLRGLQGDDLGAPDTVLATPKHYVGDGGTAWGTGLNEERLLDRGDTQVDEETLRAVFLPPYIAAIEAGAKCIMVSFSSWNGDPMHSHTYLVTDVLKNELGFEGFVVSDWAGVDLVSPDYYEAVVLSINAGVDMNMVPYDYQRFIETLTQAVETGDVSMERIDDAVRRILTVKFEMGLFEHPFGDPDTPDTLGAPEHRALAREAVAKSAVLLKNDGDVLPLAKDAPMILVAGAAADDIGIQLGGWSISWQGAAGDTTIGTTILEGIQATVDDPEVVVYDPTGHFRDLVDDAGDPLAAETCIAVLGEEPYAEWMGDNPDPGLTRNDEILLGRLRERCDDLVVILLSGRPLIITDQIDDWDALVAAWLPGTEGQGVADVLFGVEPFTGTLSFTWPRTVDQLPLGAGDGEPLFPIGFGLTIAP